MNCSEKLQVILSHFADGDWEHGEGITVESLDNPGWMVRISLAGTFLEDQDFAAIEAESSEEDWYVCRVEGRFFEAAGGVNNLANMIDVFYGWFDKKLSMTARSSPSD